MSEELLDVNSEDTPGHAQVDTSDRDTIRDIARCMWMVSRSTSGQENNTEEAKAQWKKDKKLAMKITRQFVKKLEHRGYTISKQTSGDAGSN